MNYGTTAEAYELLHNGILALQRAESNGMRVDVGYIHTAKDKIDQQILKLEKKFKKTDFCKDWKKNHKKGVFNIHSPSQLENYLYKVIKVKVSKFTKSGLGSTDEESLLQLDIADLKNLIRIKKLKKIKNTYLDGFERETIHGMMHAQSNLHLATTFRSSMQNPNIQNVSKRDLEAKKIVRSAIFPRKGHQLLELDYGQLEVRIAACYHKDPVMLKYINDTTTDMHRDMAQQIFKIKNFDKDKTGHSIIRAATKNGFVFPEFYGDYYVNCAKSMATGWGQLSDKEKWKPGQGIDFGKGKLSDHMLKQGFKELGLPVYANKKVVKKATGFTKHVQKIERHFWDERFKVYAEWKDEIWAEYLKNLQVRSFSGFTFTGPMSKNDVTNYPVQSAAFHVLLWAFTEATKVLRTDRLQTRLVGQIHDAIVLDVQPKELKKIIPIMNCIMCNDVKKKFPWINVPLEIDGELAEVDQSWAEVKPLDIPKYF